MKTHVAHEPTSIWKRLLAGTMVYALIATGIPRPAYAALTDLSPSPIAANAAAQTKPNVMLLMDTSGSMSWSHMPDEVEGVTGIGSIGYKSTQCNAIYYNPQIEYLLPKLASGTFFPQPDFYGAPYTGYRLFLTPADATDLSFPDLSQAFRAYDAKSLRATTSVPPDTAQPAYYYVHTNISGFALPLAFPSATCRQADINATTPANGGGTWTRVLASATSGPPGRVDERANFAIWYSFYRTRLALIKSAASLAFNPLNDSYRVGFITVEPKTNPTDPSINPAKYVPIADFNITQRGTWYTRLFSQPAVGASPAREGLARVGRHYAGLQDGINSGMTGDPMQYSCQQNFTIMTTDGYWNSQTETPGAGPVQLDGVTPVGQQDGNFTPFPGYTPRPIWEGNPTETTVVTDNNNTFAYAACGTYFTESTSQMSISTSQLVRSTSQLVTRTSQTRESTSQIEQSTTRQTQSTFQRREATAQIFLDTLQRSASTSQIVRYTSQTVEEVLQRQQRQVRIDRATLQVTRATSQLTQSTSRLEENTLQRRVATSRVDRSTSQQTMSTSRVTASTSQINSQTSQNNRSTSQLNRSTLQQEQRTSQDRTCDSRTEVCTPVPTGSCAAAGFFYCETVQTGPTLVASCTPATANAGNNFVTTTCNNIATGPTPVASCTPTAANAGNNYTMTTCNTATTGPTPIAGCTPSGPTAGNNYIDTTCSVNQGPLTPVASCSPVLPTAGNNYTATNCSTATTGPTAVASCTPIAASAGNAYTATTCNPINTGPTGVASCTPDSPTAGNNYTTTTCNTATTGPIAVSSCTTAAANAGNSWVATTCTPVTTGPTPVASCSPSAATALNSWTTTTCPNVVGTAAGVASCTPIAPTAGNNYTETTCTNVTTGPSGVASCTPATASAGNNWTDTTCNTAMTGPTPGPAASCPANVAPSAGNSYVGVTCTNNTTGPTAVASCSASPATSGNTWTATTCTPFQVQPWTGVAACTPDPASAGNGFVSTDCRSITVSTTPVGTCVPSGPNGGGQSVICSTNTTGPTGVQTCTPQTANAGNNWIDITCGVINTGPTLVANCSPSAAAAGNQWTTTTCSSVTTGPTAVASCTPEVAGPGNNYVATNCTINTTGPTAVQTCTPIPASAGNNYTETTCPDLATGPTPVASCTASGPTVGNNWVDTTCQTVNTGPTPVASCSSPAPAAGNSYTTTTCTTNNTGPTPVSSCTPAAASAGNSFVATTCVTNVSPDTGVASCTPDPATAGNNWTETQCVTVTTAQGAQTCMADPANGGNQWTTTSCNTVATGPTLTASCTNAMASGSNQWTSTSCNTVTTGPTVVGSCTPSGANAGNNYVATTCATISGQKIQYQTTTTITTTNFSNGVPIGPPVIATSTGPSTDLNGVCYAPPAAPPPLPTPNPQRAGLMAGPYPPAPCAAWPCSTTTNNSSGSANSLADVAQYYYVTDLRPAMTNNVPAVGNGAEDDRAPWQHMTTFTIGLGVSGTLNYRRDYKTALTGDFAEIRTGPRNWPLWPDPGLNYDPFSGGSYANWNNLKSIDDFWHTAVNGRGTYFSADRPGEVVTGLAEALAGVQERVGSDNGISVSNPEPVAGDNFAYASTYTTLKWIGDVQAFDINVTNGTLSGTPNWSAQAKLDAATGAACDNRTIYLLRPGATDNKVNFTLNSRACDGMGNPTGPADTGLTAGDVTAFFGPTTVSNLSHYTSMTDGSAGTVDQRTEATGERLVNYLRGQRGREGFIPDNLNRLYRSRTNVLGDIVNGQPVYVRAPFANYQDAGYSAFKAANAGRAPMLYVPANDGMLHAFRAGTSAVDPQGGTEAWAFVPSAVLPELYKLADRNYKNNHRFFVDGTPLVGDAYDGSTWKTVLVGGLGGGGKSYYALDVTDPAAPKGLWEFQHSTTCYNGTPATAGADCHLGYTYGTPVLTKLSDGSWVVIFTSGYNNVNSPAAAGDGEGYLYVLNAFTGQIRYKIATGAGDETTPSGLAQINNFVDYTLINNTTRQVYGGDLLGNVWRFDVNDTIAPAGREAALVGVATAPNGSPQPITTRPELAELNTKPMVFVGTGKLLGASDFVDTQVQSVYGIVDTLSSGPVYGNFRTTFKPLAMTQSGSTRTVACTGTALQCGSPDGWVVDLPDKDPAVTAVGAGGERVNVDMRLVRGTLIFASNVPTSDPCSTGGYSWLNFLSFSSGLAVSSQNSGLDVSVQSVNSLATGLNIIGIQGRLIGVRQFSNATPVQRDPIPFDPPNPFGKRISWREIAQ